MTTIRVMRRNLGTEKETMVSGYSRIGLPMAVQFLDHEAQIEARESKLTIRDDNIEKDGKIVYRRFLVEEHNGQKDVVLFYLKFIEQVDEFKQNAFLHTQSLRDLIETLDDEGDTEETSQRICLVNALNNLETCINGVEDSDFPEEL